MDKDLKILIQKLEAQGWEVRKSSRGWKAIPPDKSKPMVTIHGTARGPRSWDNMILQLKRSGFMR